MEGNSKVEERPKEPAVTLSQLYAGQIWTTPDLSTARKILSIQKKTAKIKWTGDWESGSVVSTMCSLDEFVWWVMKTGAQPLLLLATT